MHIIMLSLHLPFTLSATLLLTFYWHETISSTSLQINTSLEQFRIPFYVCAGTLPFLLSRRRLTSKSRVSLCCGIGDRLVLLFTP